MNPKLPGRNTLKERIAPGFWIDADDNLHVSVQELLVEHGLEDTPENRARVTDLAREIIRSHNPNAKIRERQTPQD